jgi:ABC-type phosphate transport system substrate-binding protein
MRRAGRAGRLGSTLAGLVLWLAAGSAAAADVVAVVSTKSSVDTLSRSQVMDLFLGKSSRFPGGRAAVPVDQAEGSDARNAFYLTFADKSPAQMKAHWSKVIFTGRGQPPQAVASGVLVKKVLAGNPGAIGYLERSEVDDSVKVVLSR